MPRITTYGVSVALVKEISKPLIDDLAKITNTPRDYFTLQVNQDVFIEDGVESAGAAFIEVCLFDRGVEVEDEFIKVITEHFQKNGCANIDIYVTHLTKRHYYENAKHF